MSRLFSLALIPLVVTPTWAAEISVRGRVVDETNGPVAGARIRFSPHGALEVVSTNAAGEFELKLPGFGRYSVEAAREQFFPLRSHTIEIVDDRELLIVLNRQQELFESVKVTENQADVDLDRNHTEESLSGKQILDTPYPEDRYLRNSFRLMPGVTQDNRGGMHFSGGAENQVLYTLDGFNIADPITGVFDTRVSVDAVRSIDYSSGYLSPEAGKGSAGVVAIQTKMGDDKIRYTATNFIPGVDSHKGLRMGAFAPRLGASGPLKRGRAWFSDNLDVQYLQSVVQDLPKGQDAAGTWQGSNLARTQVNLKPTNILYGSLLTNVMFAANVGLGPLDPISTTTDRRSRSWFYSVKDQMVLGHGLLVDVGFAEMRTMSRQMPQGSGFYELTPLGREGNYFLNSRQNSERNQWLSNVSLPAMHALGKHQIRAGIDVDTVEYGQEAHRTGYEQFNSAGLLLWRTTFTGPATVRVSNLEASWYVMDSWTPRRQVRVEYGVRQDWDRLSDQRAFSPRTAVSYAPWTNTRLSAGFAVSRDTTNLELFGRPQDQQTVTTYYSAKGLPTGLPTLGPSYRAARGFGNGAYRTWTFGAERRITNHLQMTLNVTRKRGDNAPTYVNSGGNFVLADFKRDVYNAANIGVRHQVDSRHEWSLSYVRSGTLSNAVQDINADQTRIVRNNFGRMGWDMPDRLIGAGYLPTPLKRFSVAYLLDTHEGSPFSIDKDGAVVGAVNSHRFPMYFELDFHLECRMKLLRRRLALRAGMNNITDHFNPTAVNSTVGAATYMKFFGSDGRHLVFRVRTLTGE